MIPAVALIGFGEAASTLASACAGGTGWHASVFDIATDDPNLAAAKWADYARAGVIGHATVAETLTGTNTILSLVTANQALIAARSAASCLQPRALFIDMNSVAPETKRAAASAIEAAGARYVDVAVMAPVQPSQAAVPLLVSGPHAEAGAAALVALGFSAVRVMPGSVGRASAIKMIRSVMIKGAEALTAECLLAAEMEGVTAEVVASLGPGWEDTADYNLDRMMAHGLRRAAEMEEVVKTLESLGVDPRMSRGTVARQRYLGSLSMTSPPVGLAAKLAALVTPNKVGPT